MTSTPVEFLALGLDSGKFFQKRQNEFAGPCPFCGGGKDRFVIFTNRPFPHWNWFCRKCGKDGWADQLNPRLREELTPELRIEYARKQQESDIAKKNAQARVLATYQKSRIWEKYHKNLTERHRAWWRSQGIPDKWQDFWQLGYVSNLALGRTINRHAYTIPKFGFGGEPVNLDYRIIDPPEYFGKYRPVKGLPAAPFISIPSHAMTKIGRDLYIVEGAKKAMVLACHKVLPNFNCTYDYDGHSMIIGIPSCNSWCGIEKDSTRFDRKWIMFDPGAEEWAYRIATAIGKHAIVVELPDKPDDMVLAGATRGDFLAYMRKAEK